MKRLLPLLLLLFSFLFLFSCSAESTDGTQVSTATSGEFTYTTAPETPPESDTGQNYILNTNTMKFHYPTCISADSIKITNKTYYYGTRESLIEQGYNPCGRCNP